MTGRSWTLSGINHFLCLCSWVLQLLWQEWVWGIGKIWYGAGAFGTVSFTLLWVLNYAFFLLSIEPWWAPLWRRNPRTSRRWWWRGWNYFLFQILCDGWRPLVKVDLINNQYFLQAGKDDRRKNAAAEIFSDETLDQSFTTLTLPLVICLSDTIDFRTS